MTSAPPKQGRAQSTRDLPGEDGRRARLASGREHPRRRLEEVFRAYPADAPDAEPAGRVRELLTFVAVHGGDLSTRVRMAHPDTHEMVQDEWGILCGRSIRALEVPDRIRRLVLEAVLRLLPGTEYHRLEALAQAAGMDVPARATTADLVDLRKRGMFAAFGGKLLVDTKQLIAEHTREEAEAYFEAARRVASTLQGSPYRTGRDQRFLDLVRQRYHGDLLALVDAQADLTLATLADEDPRCPVLEHHLRLLLDSPNAPDRGRSLKDWAISARIAFEAEPYIYMRIDELRRAVKARLATLAQEPMLNPEASLQAARPAVAAASARLEALLARHGAPPDPDAPSRLDLWQILLENAAVLGRPEVVPELNAYLADTDLVESVARYQLAAFRKDEPDRRRCLCEELVVWDELVRSANLTPAKRHRLEAQLEGLREDLRAVGLALPVVPPTAPGLLAVGKPILAGLHDEVGFAIFERWLRRFQAVYGDRLPAEDALPLPSLPPVPPLSPGGHRSRPHAAPRKMTNPWHPSQGVGPVQVDFHEGSASSAAPDDSVDLLAELARSARALGKPGEEH